MDPNCDVHIEKRILDILASLSPAEAGLLLVLKAAGETPTDSSNQAIEGYTERIEELAEKYWRHHPEDIRNSCAQNLVRLRCIGIRTDNTGVASGVLSQVPGDLLGGARIQRDSCLIDPGAFKNLIEHIDEAIQVNAGIAEVKEHHNTYLISRSNSVVWRPPVKIPVPELTYVLTPLGSELVEACVEEPTED